MLSRRSEPPSISSRLSNRNDMPKEVRDELRRELAVDDARRELAINRVQNICTVADVAMLATAFLSRQAEVAALAVPEERGRIDVVADTGASLVQKALMDYGR
jgi:hypothetical protein